MTATELAPSTITEVERRYKFEVPCDVEGCSLSAEWAFIYRSECACFPKPFLLCSKHYEEANESFLKDAIQGGALKCSICYTPVDFKGVKKL